MNTATILLKVDTVLAHLETAKVQGELVHERLLHRTGTDLNDRPNPQDKHGLKELARFIRAADSHLQDVTLAIGDQEDA